MQNPYSRSIRERERRRPVMVSAEYAEIPANAIAEYLLKNFDVPGVKR